jgi:hypothetical protein
MTEAQHDWLEKILVNPAAEYGAPSEVLTDDRLSCEDKLRVLTEWEQDAVLLAEAVSEGMGGGEPNRLMEVRKAKLALDCMTT